MLYIALACLIVTVLIILILSVYRHSQFTRVEGINPTSFRYIPNIRFERIRNMVKHHIKITEPTILITGINDESPSQVPYYHELLDNPNLIAWFAHHNDITHPKMHYLPLGVNYQRLFLFFGLFVSPDTATWGKPAKPTTQERELYGIRDSLPPLAQRPLKAYTTAGIKLTSSSRTDKYRFSRRDMVLALRNKSFVDMEQQPVTRTESWRKHGNYSFILSPIGRGLDCYRTWEALILGCIPVVQSSPLDPVYNDLPVVIIQDWNEVTPENMLRWKKQILSRPWNMEKLKMSYWRKIMQT
ncbi:hypothetical protein KDA11_01785, partial [Candidatus Saccharibacteria bacterium]|nr:hypothetical protein [Candidatus Saccharibacteria bacterium]